MPRWQALQDKTPLSSGPPSFRYFRAHESPGYIIGPLRGYFRSLQSPLRWCNCIQPRAEVVAILRQTLSDETLVDTLYDETLAAGLDDSLPDH